MRRVSVGAVVVMGGLALARCTEPPTEIVVLLGTDVPDSVPLVVTARVALGTNGAMATHQWLRNVADAGVPADGGIVFPASFAIVPGDGPHDATVTVDVQAEASGVVLHRRAVTTFSPHVTLTLPIFLTTRCLEPATGCHASNCTVQTRCEEMNETCGNEGTCITVNAAPATNRDASFGDVPVPTACGAYHQACCNIGPACASPLSCVAGRCQRCTDAAEVCCSGADLLADGTVCAPTRNPCQTPGTCSRGVCGAIVNLADGATCSMPANSCQRGGTCTAGVCSGTANLPDGTSCGVSANPCQNDPVCSGGACGAPTNRPDGTACGAGPNACHDVRRCTGGSCGAAPALPDGTAWGGGGINRCCGGSPVQVNTTTHCNACGWTCASGESCIQLRGEPQWYCTCVANSQCPLDHCCSTFYGTPNACAASNCTGGCAACPAGATCTVDSANRDPNFCHY